MGEEMVVTKGGVVPTIDLQECPFPYAKLREACEEWGCFRVVNHSVPRSVMWEMKTVSRSLLDLPVEIKNRNAVPSPGSGYLSFGQLGNSIFESLGFSSPDCPEAIQTFCSQLDILSSSDRAVIKTYTGAICELMDDIANKIATSLGLSAERRRDLFKDWFRHTGMNKYNFTPETIGSYALPPHTDHGLLVVLQDDEAVGGLQVVKEEDKLSGSSSSFVTVESSPGNFIIILGDMAVVWSNGRFTSGKHSVRCTDAAVRVTLGTLLGPPLDSAVEAPEELVDSQHPRLYTPFYFKEYYALRSSKKMHNGEALSSFVLDPS